MKMCHTDKTMASRNKHCLCLREFILLQVWLKFEIIFVSDDMHEKKKKTIFPPQYIITNLIQK